MPTMKPLGKFVFFHLCQLLNSYEIWMQKMTKIKTNNNNNTPENDTKL